MTEWCHNNFINHKAVKEAAQLEEQLIGICKAVGIQNSGSDFFKEAYCANLRKAIAYGFHHRSAILTDPENDGYMSSHGECHGLLDASSGLATGRHEWIVYNKLSEGSSWYYQVATAIELDWLLVRTPIYSTTELYLGLTCL